MKFAPPSRGYATLFVLRRSSVARRCLQAPLHLGVGFGGGHARLIQAQLAKFFWIGFHRASGYDEREFNLSGTAVQAQEFECRINGCD